MNKDPFEHLLDYLFELSGVDVFVEITSWSFFTLKGGNGGKDCLSTSVDNRSSAWCPNFHSSLSLSNSFESKQRVTNLSLKALSNATYSHSLVSAGSMFSNFFNDKGTTRNMERNSEIHLNLPAVSEKYDKKYRCYKKLQ